MTGARVWPEDAQLAMSFVVNVEEGAEYNPPGRRPAPRARGRAGHRAEAARAEPRQRIAATSTASGRARRACSPCSIAIASRRRSRRPRSRSSARRSSRAPSWPPATRCVPTATAGSISSRWTRTSRARVHRKGRRLHREDHRPAAHRLALAVSVHRAHAPPPHRSGLQLSHGRLLRRRPVLGRRGGGAIVVMPYALDSNDMKMWVAPAFTPEQWLAYAVDTFDVLYDEGARRRG